MLTAARRQRRVSCAESANDSLPLFAGFDASSDGLDSLGSASSASA